MSGQYFKTAQEAREASKNMKDGTVIYVNGVKAKVVAPARMRYGNAPKSIQFIEEPPVDYSTGDSDEDDKTVTSIPEKPKRKYESLAKRFIYGKNVNTY